MSTDIAPSDVIAFWKEAGADKWFAKDAAFDADFRMQSAEGALALMILLDQFPRNVFRGTGHAFATDPLALSLARQALAAGFDQRTEMALRRFFYLPFQHSEAMADQDRALALFQALDRPANDRWAEHHHGVIARFGRFPHRNRALGRETTLEEQAFLDQDGFTG